MINEKHRTYIPKCKQEQQQSTHGHKAVTIVFSKNYIENTTIHKLFLNV